MVLVAAEGACDRAIRNDARFERFGGRAIR
jgi:hypothetical protein